MEIKKQFASQVRLVQHDQIPLAGILNQESITEITKLFSFSSGEIRAGENSVTNIRFQGGLHKSEKRTFPITDFSIDPRKMTLNIEGTSEGVDEIFVILNKKMKKLAGDSSDDFLKPIVVADDSEIISSLSFEFEKLFSNGLGGVVDGSLKKAIGREDASAIIKPLEISFEIDYLPNSEKLIESRITLSKKKFKLSPRQGYSITDKVFLSVAPLRTKEHISILAELEKIFEAE